MLVKSRKSSFNSNMGEFCSVIFVFVSVFFFLRRIKLLRYISNFKAYAIKRFKRIFAEQGVQEMFFRLSFSYFNKLRFIN